ncbi:type VI secretion system lipoprotein TssJ [Chitinolyticbacter meiyuanensis]|uniref:type VI secretion system lipoprotein TssJ n=1 Tax=Chitinolyticbacter meiyuanensis TaxID=682798 RepID=UPI0011E5B373|nr:type VI secretion system lipoprotein TssJ [Chitinolyticbacter meiyuanensis]
MRNLLKFISVLACFSLAFLLSGCASTARSAAIPYQVDIAAAKNVNPDARRRPSPIVVKVFELRAAAAFESSDFFSLQEKPESALGAELIAVERVILRPGETKSIARPGNLDARAIGIVAEYRALESSHWRQVVELPQPKQLNLYKFWQTSPDRMIARINIKDGGIELLPAAK